MPVGRNRAVHVLHAFDIPVLTAPVFSVAPLLHPAVQVQIAVEEDALAHPDHRFRNDDTLQPRAFHKGPVRDRHGSARNRETRQRLAAGEGVLTDRAQAGGHHQFLQHAAAFKGRVADPVDLRRNLDLLQGLAAAESLVGNRQQVFRQRQGPQRAAVAERIARKHLQPSRQMDFFQHQTSGEHPAAHFRHGIRNPYAPQGFTVAESAAADGRQRLRQFDFLQSAAVRKGVVPDQDQRIRNPDLRQHVAEPEGRGPDFRHFVRNRNRCQEIAVFKGPHADLFNAVRQVDALQLTVAEGIISDFGHRFRQHDPQFRHFFFPFAGGFESAWADLQCAFGNGELLVLPHIGIAQQRQRPLIHQRAVPQHQRRVVLAQVNFLQVLASHKGVPRHVNQTVRNRELRQARAFRKGAVFNQVNACRQADRLNACAGLEGAFLNGLQALRQDHFLQFLAFPESNPSDNFDIFRQGEGLPV